MLNRFFVLMVCFSMCGSEQLSATRFGTRLVGGPITFKEEIDVSGNDAQRGFSDENGCVVEHWVPMKNRCDEEPSSDESSADEAERINQNVAAQRATYHGLAAIAKARQELSKHKPDAEAFPEAVRPKRKKPGMTIEELPDARRRLSGRKTAFNIAGNKRSKKGKSLAQAPQLEAAYEEMPPLERPSTQDVQPPLAILATVALDQEEERAPMLVNYDSVN
jgi:hypothetical protein